MRLVAWRPGASGTVGKRGSDIYDIVHKFSPPDFTMTDIRDTCPTYAEGFLEPNGAKISEGDGSDT